MQYFIYTVYTVFVVHKVDKKQAYPIEKSQFFLRPFYVLSTSFLRNGYMEVRKLLFMFISKCFVIKNVYFLFCCLFARRWHSHVPLPQGAPHTEQYKQATISFYPTA